MIKKLALIFNIVVFLLFFSSNAGASTDIQKTAHTAVSLYTDGKNEAVVQIDIEKGWHIYWSNPGEIGLPTEIYSPQGDLQIIGQSVPQIRQEFDSMEEYVYNGRVFYQLRVPKMQDYFVKISYVECNDTCKSESLTFDLSKAAGVVDEDFVQIKETAQKTFPQRIKLVSPLQENSVQFENSGAQTIKFIPATRDLIDIDSLQIKNKGQKAQIQWLDNGAQKLPQALIIINDKAYFADIIYTDLTDNSLIYILFLAFIGGIILNAMPCVFPVLSLKIFSILQEENSLKRHSHAFGYLFGVLASFWFLTAILVILKKQGEAIGWGFQLQSPLFVAIMAIIFLLLFLFMIDWIHFPDLTSDIIHKAAGVNAFCTGFFAVLIASPCTGPFMGAAVGYAFMQSSLKIFAVFTALAVGYALPYILMVLYPAFISRILPRPGKWMKHLKTILAIPVLLTSLWLFWVLATQMHTTSDSNTESALPWRDYNVQEIEEIAQGGGNVFIDFTAKWCLTCQFNEKFMLNSANFKNFVAANNVYLFKADLTEDNDIYNAALSSYGRDGIPVYVYYNNGSYKILPIFFKIADLQK